MKSIIEYRTLDGIDAGIRACQDVDMPVAGPFLVLTCRQKNYGQNHASPCALDFAATEAEVALKIFEQIKHGETKMVRIIRTIEEVARLSFDYWNGKTGENCIVPLGREDEDENSRLWVRLRAIVKQLLINHRAAVEQQKRVMEQQKVEQRRAERRATWERLQKEFGSVDEWAGELELE